jgi:hypothetical protein
MPIVLLTLFASAAAPLKTRSAAFLSLCVSVLKHANFAALL